MKPKIIARFALCLACALITALLGWQWLPLTLVIAAFVYFIWLA